MAIKIATLSAFIYIIYLNRSVVFKYAMYPKISIPKEVKAIHPGDIVDTVPPNKNGKNNIAPAIHTYNIAINIVIAIPIFLSII